MSSKNSNSVEIRIDRSVKKSNDQAMKKVYSNKTDQSSSKTHKSFIEMNKSNISNPVVKRDLTSKNPFVNKSLKQANLKQITESESKINFLKKIKLMEQELERYEYEKNLITQELDKVCEQKDNQMKQLKSELYEKQQEIDHQMSAFRQNRNDFEEELNQCKQKLQDMKVEFKHKESDLLSKNKSLEEQLADLNDYIRNREHTLTKINKLEEMVKQQKLFHKRTKEKLINELQNEKLKVGELVDERVEELKLCMEKSCLSKLSVDARIALQKFEELAKNYEMVENECRALRKTNENFKHKIYNQRINLEVSESLLHEMLKQMERRLRNRKDVGIQSVVTLE